MNKPTMPVRFALRGAKPTGGFVIGFARSRCGVSLRRGLTLIETLIAATVLSIVATSALLPFTAGASHALAAIRLQKATAYGQAMMEEVLARPFYGPDGTTNPPGPDTSFEDRRHRFDDLDDYSGFTEQVTGMRDYVNQPITDPDAAGYFWDLAYASGGSLITPSQDWP